MKGEAIDGRDGAANVAWVKVHWGLWLKGLGPVVPLPVRATHLFLRRRAVKGEAIDGRDGAANVAWVKVHFMATKVCPCCDGAVLCLNGSAFSFPF